MTQIGSEAWNATIPKTALQTMTSLAAADAANHQFPEINLADLGFPIDAPTTTDILAAVGAAADALLDATDQDHNATASNIDAGSQQQETCKSA